MTKPIFKLNVKPATIGGAADWQLDFDVSYADPTINGHNSGYKHGDVPERLVDLLKTHDCTADSHAYTLKLGEQVFDHPTDFLLAYAEKIKERGTAEAHRIAEPLETLAADFATQISSPKIEALTQTIKGVARG